MNELILRFMRGYYYTYFKGYFGTGQDSHVTYDKKTTGNTTKCISNNINLQYISLMH
jgi:hypothetical protein